MNDSNSIDHVDMSANSDDRSSDNVGNDVSYFYANYWTWKKFHKVYNLFYKQRIACIIFPRISKSWNSWMIIHDAQYALLCRIKIEQNFKRFQAHLLIPVIIDIIKISNWNLHILNVKMSCLNLIFNLISHQKMVIERDWVK